MALKTAVILGLAATAEAFKLPATPTSRRDALVNAGAGFAAAFALTTPANAEKVPTIFTVLPAKKSGFREEKPWSAQKPQGCNTEKPCAKGATLWGQYASLGAQPPGK